MYISVILFLVSIKTIECDLLSKNCTTFQQNHVLTIPCDFQFVENDPFYPQTFLDRLGVNKMNSSLPKQYEFECEEHEEKPM